jgi:uncharacterized protein (DUF433 family)
MAVHIEQSVQERNQALWESGVISEDVRSTNFIRRDPEIMGGTPVFAGTRVPIRNLIEYLNGGENLDVFLDDFPSVSREQAVAA